MAGLLIETATASAMLAVETATPPVLASTSASAAQQTGQTVSIGTHSRNGSAQSFRSLAKTGMLSVTARSCSSMASLCEADTVDTADAADADDDDESGEGDGDDIESISRDDGDAILRAGAVSGKSDRDILFHGTVEKTRGAFTVPVTKHIGNAALSEGFDDTSIATASNDTHDVSDANSTPPLISLHPPYSSNAPVQEIRTSPFEESLAVFQEKFARYDRASWESVLEREESKLGLVQPKKRAQVKAELIDVDLVRGSMFFKAKPREAGPHIIRKGFVRAIFFPFFRSWWSQELSFRPWIIGTVLYLLHSISVAVYMWDDQADLGPYSPSAVNMTRMPSPFGTSVSSLEVFFPLGILVVLGIVYAQVAATTFTGTGRGEAGDSSDSDSDASASDEDHHHSSSENDDQKTGAPAVVGGGCVDGQSAGVAQLGATGVRSRTRSTRGTARHASSVRPPRSAGRSAAGIGQSKAAGVGSSSSGHARREPTAHRSLFSDMSYVPEYVPEITGPPAAIGRVSASLWDANDVCHKVSLTLPELSSAIIDKVSRSQESSLYVFTAIAGGMAVAILPAAYRVLMGGATSGRGADGADFLGDFDAGKALSVSLGLSWSCRFVVVTSMLSTFCLSFAFFFALAVAERTYHQRFLYAKYFGVLTSMRRARRCLLPHFRLHKVCNIKMWLSLRSYLKRKGPQRSVDTVVSSSFILALFMIGIMTAQVLGATKDVVFLTTLFNWEIALWCLLMSLYLLRFLTLGARINRKYQNTCLLLTEQINLYLRMEQAPHKKSELVISNNVLKLATKLLKELESPYKISGLSMNPLLYNVTRMVVLSAFSAVMSELLGFKLKIWKINAKM